MTHDDLMPLDELAMLLTDMTGAGLTRRQKARLGELTSGDPASGDPAARERYLEYVELHTMLLWEHGMAAEPSASAARRARWAGLFGSPHGGADATGSSILSRPAALSAISSLFVVACVILVLAILRPARIEPSGKPAPEIVAEHSSLRAVATLVDAVDCRWDDAARELRPGERLPAASWTLIEGTARIAFDSGAEIIVSGPARFRVDSASAVTLHSGMLTSTVPPRAIGFRVEAPGVHVVDLGTAFGVYVEGSEASEVRVFAGRVEATPSAGRGDDGRPIQLVRGQAARFHVDGRPVGPPMIADDQFVRVMPADPNRSVYLLRTTPSMRHWNESEFWSDGRVPSRGKDYHVGIDSSGKPTDKMELRAHPDNAVPFGGGSLTIHPGGKFRTKTFADFRKLVLAGGTLYHGGGSKTHRVGGAFGEIEVATDSTIQLGYYSTKKGGVRELRILARLTGEGALRVEQPNSNVDVDGPGAHTGSKVVLLHQDNRFHGDWDVDNVTLVAQSPGSLGTGSVSIRRFGAVDARYTIANRRAALSIERGGRMRLDGDHEFGEAAVHGERLAARRYSLEELQGRFPDCFFGSGGSLTVVGIEPAKADASASFENLESNATP